jgi:hypothetical protein
LLADAEKWLWHKFREDDCKPQLQAPGTVAFVQVAARPRSAAGNLVGRFHELRARATSSLPLTAISLNHVNGATPLVRAWGGSASTLHDVGATGDTGPNWGSTTYSTASYLSVYARVYLNANEWCETDPIGTRLTAA